MNFSLRKKKLEYEPSTRYKELMQKIGSPTITVPELREYFQLTLEDEWIDTEAKMEICLILGSVMERRASMPDAPHLWREIQDWKEEIVRKREEKWELQ